MPLPAAWTLRFRDLAVLALSQVLFLQVPDPECPSYSLSFNGCTGRCRRVLNRIVQVTIHSYRNKSSQCGGSLHCLPGTVAAHPQESSREFSCHGNDYLPGIYESMV